MKRIPICVVGCGYVGLVTGACLAEIGHVVRCVDNDASKISALRAGKIPIYEKGLDTIVHRNVKRKRLSFASTLVEGMDGAKVIFIAVGTPPHPDGSADLRFIDDVAKEIALHLKDYVVVAEKSTVPVETGEEVERTITENNVNHVPFDMVSNPEFLREGTAVFDFLNPDRIVIGSKSKRATALMRAVYAPIKGKFLITDLKSAELIKHASNSFLATKISFINSVSRVCELVGADVKQVAEGMGLDPRIGPSFLHAGIGFGGFCLPKDIEAFHYISSKVGYEFDLLRVARDVNQQAREHFVRRIRDVVGELKGKTIALWGIAFKANTDDIRFAPALDVIERLQAAGCRIKAYDPVAMEKAASILKNVELCKTPYDAVTGADALAIVTEWPQFKTLNFKKVKELMGQATIVDGRNLLDGDKMRSAGFRYRGVGRFSS